MSDPEWRPDSTVDPALCRHTTAAAFLARRLFNRCLAILLNAVTGMAAMASRCESLRIAAPLRTSLAACLGCGGTVDRRHPTEQNDDNRGKISLHV